MGPACGLCQDSWLILDDNSPTVRLLGPHLRGLEASLLAQRKALMGHANSWGQPVHFIGWRFGPTADALLWALARAAPVGLRHHNAQLLPFCLRPMSTATCNTGYRWLRRADVSTAEKQSALKATSLTDLQWLMGMQDNQLLVGRACQVTLAYGQYKPTGC